MWLQLIQKATIHRIEGNNSKYIVAVDALVRTLLKNERDPIKKLKTELVSKATYGLDRELDVYDALLEATVDILESSGYLTRDFVIETFTGEIPEERE